MQSTVSLPLVLTSYRLAENLPVEVMCPLSKSLLALAFPKQVKELTDSLRVKSNRPKHPLGVAHFQGRKLQKERTLWERKVHLNEIRMF